MRFINTGVISAKENERQPRVSIITVCYNSAATIRDTIESVINQSYPNIEYIIIDGGSNDGTVDIIRAYEQRISKWVSEADEGIYDAMNKGIKWVSGEIIGILNSDDWYASDAVQTAVDAIIEGKSDIIHGNIIICDRDGKPLFKFEGSDDIHNKVKKHMPIFHPTMFVKSEVYCGEGLYNNNFKITGDYDFFCRVINKYNIKYLDHTLTYVRLGGVSTTRHWRLSIEEYKIRKNNNMNTLANILIIGRTTIGPFLRTLMEKHGAGKLVIWFRKYRRSRIHYFEDE